VEQIETDIIQLVLKMLLQIDGTLLTGDSVHKRKTAELEEMAQCSVIKALFKGKEAFIVKRIDL
jgi:hypothetical protein